MTPLTYMAGREFCRKILNGERDFSGVRLEEGFDLQSFSLRDYADYSRGDTLNRYLEKQNFGLDQSPIIIKSSELVGVNAQRLYLPRLVAHGANLKGVNFYGAYLEDSDFTGATLDDVSFGNANLKRARFERAKLVRAKLDTADCRNADFWKADLRGASLAQAELFGANFGYANLCGAWLLRAHDLEGAIFYETDIDKRTIECTNGNLVPQQCERKIFKISEDGKIHTVSERRKIK